MKQFQLILTYLSLFIIFALILYERVINVKSKVSTKSTTIIDKGLYVDTTTVNTLYNSKITIDGSNNNIITVGNSIKSTDSVLARSYQIQIISNDSIIVYDGNRIVNKISLDEKSELGNTIIKDNL